MTGMEWLAIIGAASSILGSSGSKGGGKGGGAPTMMPPPISGQGGGSILRSVSSLPQDLASRIAAGIDKGPMGF